MHVYIFVCMYVCCYSYISYIYMCLCGKATRRRYFARTHSCFLFICEFIWRLCVDRHLVNFRTPWHDVKPFSLYFFLHAVPSFHFLPRQNFLPPQEFLHPFSLSLLLPLCTSSGNSLYTSVYVFPSADTIVLPGRTVFTTKPHPTLSMKTSG